MLDFVMMNEHPEAILTVSQITRGIKTILEDEYRDISLFGEISNFKKHSSGHLYFTMKDSHAQISAVMFRGNSMNMFFTPRDGMEVICRGNISVYEPRGNYQMLVREMHPKGEGALRVAFEKMKQQLFEDGLFDVGRKQPIPRFPKRIALITSPMGAAIRDMLSVLQKKNPSVQVFLVPVQVQGSGAAEQIAGAIDICNEYGEVDIIIAGRGGGSLEDLWAFNEEVVARAIHRSHIPVISAVGHEVDFTISDFAADARAATPSVAADMVVMDRQQLLSYLKEISLTIDKFVRLNVEKNRTKVHSLATERTFTNMFSLVRQYMQLLDDHSGRLGKVAELHLDHSRYKVNILESRLHAHDAKKILRKGYAVLRSEGNVVSTIDHTAVGQQVTAELFDGMLSLHVISKNERYDKNKIANI